MPTAETSVNAIALLRWYAEMGVDHPVAEDPVNRFCFPQAPAPPSGAEDIAPTPRMTIIKGAPALSLDDAVRTAQRLARDCDSLSSLAKAVADFEACPLKSGARSTVFADGIFGAPLLVIGEGPGRDEDRIGRPFVGRAGVLLDKMLASIGYSRETNALITNVIFWRPPGNRAPTAAETAICRPFVERLIELSSPKAVLLAGATPLLALLGVTGIMRARGKWREIRLPSGASIAALPTFHPAFLLRSPGHKRHAWADLQALERRLRES